MVTYYVLLITFPDLLSRSMSRSLGAIEIGKGELLHEEPTVC
jgi:hypothetical protein